MEVILGPMLASQPCLHGFWVLTSLHFYCKCFFIILVNIIDITPSNAVALLRECGFNFKSKWSLLISILNVPLEKMEKIRAIIEEDEVYEYALEIALEWWINNTSEASWKELVSMVYRCGETDTADDMMKRLSKYASIVYTCSKL